MTSIKPTDPYNSANSAQTRGDSPAPLVSASTQSSDSTTQAQLGDLSQPEYSGVIDSIVQELQSSQIIFQLRETTLEKSLMVLARENLDAKQIKTFADIFLDRAESFYKQFGHLAPFEETHCLAAAETYARLYKANSPWNEFAVSLETKLGKHSQLWTVLMSGTQNEHSRLNRLVHDINDPKQIAYIKTKIDSLAVDSYRDCRTSPFLKVFFNGSLI